MFWHWLFEQQRWTGANYFFHASIKSLEMSGLPSSTFHHTASTFHHTARCHLSMWPFVHSLN